MKDIYLKLADIFEVEIVHPTDEFENFEEWDSLTTLTLISMLDSDYDIQLTADKVNQFVYVQDLIDYLECKCQSIE